MRGRGYYTALLQIPGLSFPAEVWEDVQYAHYVVFTIATSLQIRIESGVEDFLDLAIEERWMDANLSLEVSQEEHDDGTPMVV